MHLGSFRSTGTASHHHYRNKASRRIRSRGIHSFFFSISPRYATRKSSTIDSKMLYSIPFPASKEKNCVKNKKKRTERYLMKYVNSDVATGNFCKSCQNMGGNASFTVFFCLFLHYFLLERLADSH